jgi:hypothetical protein
MTELVWSFAPWATIFDGGASRQRILAGGRRCCRAHHRAGPLIRAEL